MFDYQAGEKYRLTLIMIGLSGLLAGMFFSFLLMPTPEAPVKRRPAARYMSDPDITGVRTHPSIAASATAETNKAQMVDPYQAKLLIDQWLPLAWDLSSSTACASQEKAISYMTEECAKAYRHNIWTEDLSKQIDEAGLQSSFAASKISVGNVMADGSLVISVEGKQTLNVSGKGSRCRAVKLEYLIKATPDGMRIAGISEVGKDKAHS